MVEVKFLRDYKGDKAKAKKGEIVLINKSAAEEFAKLGYVEILTKKKQLPAKEKVKKKKEITTPQTKKEKEVVDKFTQSIQGLTDKRMIIKKFLDYNPLFYDKSKNWWIWDKENFRWTIVDETDILNALNTKANLNTLNSSEKNEILEGFKQEGRKKIPRDIKPDWIQFKNRIYKIGEDDFIFASPEYFVTNPIPWEIGKSKETPVMDKIFEEWVGKDYVQTLYQIIAYCLLPDYPLQRLFCFTGSGMNGKSCFLSLVEKFLGRENTTTTELDVLINSRFEITRLYKKLACMMGETDFGEIKKTSILKKLTGNDLIGFEYKGKNPFEAKNYAKILISTNNLPATSDKTPGFYRRWLIVDFFNKFSEKKDILDSIPDVEYQNLCRKCIDVLWGLLKKREFHNEGTVEDRTKRFEDKSNPLGKFLKEYTVEDMSNEIFKFEFKKRLDDFCKENNFREITETTLGIQMKDLGYHTSRKSADWFTKEGTRPTLRTWVGLKWKKVS